MVVELEISEDMIKCFYYCNDLGNYINFFNDYQQFLSKLSENLRLVTFESDRLCQILSQNCISLFEFLPKYPETVPRRSSRKITESLEKYIPDFCEDLKQAISSKNWDNFYWKYRSTADKIISEGRKQRWIQMVIEYRNFYDSVSVPSLYESFEARDSVANYRYDTKERTTEKRESGESASGHEKIFTHKLIAIKPTPNTPHYPDSMESFEKLEHRMVNFEILQNDIKEKLEKEIQQTESKIQKSISSKTKRNEESFTILKEEMRTELNALRQSIQKSLSESQNEMKTFVKKEVQDLELKLNEKMEIKMEDFKKREELWKKETVNMIMEMLDKSQIPQEPFESKTDQLRKTSEPIPEVRISDHDLEKVWMDCIKSCKKYIKDLHEHFASFEKTFQTLDDGEFGSTEVQEARLYELSNFLGSVLRTHIALENEFKRLRILEEEHHHSMFPKILKKCLADLAIQLLEIVEAIENLETDHNGFEILEKQMENLKPSSIYSIGTLKSICISGHLPESYDYVNFPQMKRSPESCISDVETIVSLDDESEDEEYRRMQEEYQRKIDEQNREYERELKLAQQQRADMNRKAEEELRRHGEKFKRSTVTRRGFN